MQIPSLSGALIVEHYCIVYLVFVSEFEKNVTRQIWRALFHFGKYLFQSTRHFGKCLKKMVSHTADGEFIYAENFRSLNTSQFNSRL